MAGELLGLSKFKLQLLALISEARHLRERERGAREELLFSNQRQKQIEADYARKLQELYGELALRDELQRKLETKVKDLEHENELLEKKEKELKDTVKSLLQARDSFISIYEDSTFTLRCSIEMRDRKLVILSEKIEAHLSLFDSIEKETAVIKQVLDRIQHLVNDKEQAVSSLKMKMDKISVFEKDFVEKICFLENKLSGYEHELRRRNTMICELKERFEEQKSISNVQPQIEELRQNLLMKEEVIKSLTSERQALHVELRNMELTLHTTQDVVKNMSAKDQKTLSPSLVVQEVCQMNSQEENECSENIIQTTGEDSPSKKIVGDTMENAAEVLHEQHMQGDETSCKMDVPASCLPKDNGTLLVQGQNPENSMTRAEALEGL